MNRKNIALVAVLLAAGLAIFAGVRLGRPVLTGSKEPATTEDARPSPIAENVDVLVRPPRPAPNTGAGERARSAGVVNAQSASAGDGSKDWSVVAATLNSAEAAERRASSLKSQWKDCACTVFPKGESERYFVVVGSGLERESADRLRDRATAAGLPGDTYVTKLIRRPGDPAP